jgi:hypothetical protein
MVNYNNNKNKINKNGNGTLYQGLRIVNEYGSILQS